MGDPILGSNEELIKDQGDTRPDPDVEAGDTRPDPDGRKLKPKDLELKVEHSGDVPG